MAKEDKVMINSVGCGYVKEAEAGFVSLADGRNLFISQKTSMVSYCIYACII